MKRNKPILVTGSHRSGSTWLGKMIALSLDIAYIHEPFNPKSSICKSAFDYWFTYINEQNEYLYEESLRGCVDLSYPISRELKEAHSLKDIGRILRDKYWFIQYKMKKKRLLLKDPISLFSADWLYEKFAMDVIVIIRHPAAFVGSLKKAGWIHPFNHFIEQPLLMENTSPNYRKIIQEYAKCETSIIDQGILLWNIIHERILEYKQQYNDDWIFVRHEDLSRTPLKGFEQIYKKLNLDFSECIGEKILDYTSAAKKSNLKRDSQSNIWSWKKRLTNDEIKKIKNNTFKIHKNFYSERDW